MAHYTHIPVIVVSGAGVMDDVVQALRLGASDYLVKPILDMAMLEHSVQRNLALVTLEKQNQQYRDHLESVNRELRNGLDELRSDQQAGRQVQMKMLPEFVEKQGLSFKHIIKPSLMLSGDFLDYFPLDDEHFGFYIATQLEFSFTQLSEDSFIGNDIDEGNCCGVTGPTVLDNGLLGGYTGNGDIIQITVPATANGIATIGLGLAVGDNGGAPLGVDVSVNGNAAGVITPMQNSSDWENTHAGMANTFFLTLDTPLAEGDVVALTPSADFSAGTGLHLGFYGNTYAAVSQFPFSSLPAESFVGNDTDEGNCCGVTGPTVLDNGLLGGFTGNGDIVNITVPAAGVGSSVVGLGIAVGDNGGAPLGVDVSVNGESVGVITPMQNSSNWETTLFGSPSIFFLDIGTPLNAGDVVSITPSGDFAAGTGLHFGFYQ